MLHVLTFLGNRNYFTVWGMVRRLLTRSSALIYSLVKFFFRPVPTYHQKRSWFCSANKQNEQTIDQSHSINLHSKLSVWLRSDKGVTLDVSFSNLTTAVNLPLSTSNI